MKTKMFSNSQICLKPEAEFDWTSEVVERLCTKAGIKNPGTDFMVDQFSSPNATPRIPVIASHHSRK
ncbi:MAG TPA: hypothetical protein VL335_01825 [Candidatus Paceibacterota bacterium]|nr:hypothetical protein [Candidatus Paceibacterota bacterium]